MWIVQRHATATMYYTGRDRVPWSSELKDAVIYDTQTDAEDAGYNMAWPPGDIEIASLPWRKS